MGKVNIPPHAGATQQSVPRDIIVHPNKEVVDVDVLEHGSRAVVHLGIRARRDDKVLAGGVLGQVEVGKELVLFSGAELEDVSSHPQSPLGAVGAGKVELAIATVESHEVSRTLARPIIKHRGPVLPVVHSREGELRPKRSV